MSMTNSAVSSLIFGMMLCGGAFAAQNTAPARGAFGSPPGTSSAPVVDDCNKVGTNVSALIDASPNSPNISAAKVAFELGTMECMEGDDQTAKKFYENAKNLLVKNYKTVRVPRRQS